MNGDIACRRSPWARVHPGAHTHGLRLICVAHAGGGASAFHDWAVLLQESLELWAVQLPGRESRWNEPPIARFDPLIDELEQGLGAYDTVPYALFGVSMGALIAYELACRATATGRRAPTRLFVASCASPDRFVLKRVQQLDDDGLVMLLQRTSARADAIIAHPELLSLALRVLRADLRVCASYRATAAPPLNCSIVALRGADDDLVMADEVAAWRSVTTGGFEMYTMSGGHLFMFEGRTRATTELIRRTLGNGSLIAE